MRHAVILALADSASASATAAVLATLPGGSEVRERTLPPDASTLQAEIIDLCDREGLALIVTCGGTGLHASDRVPQATAAVLDYELPGIPQALRERAARGGADIAPAALFRGVAGVRGRTLIVNLPLGPQAASMLEGLVLTLALALDLLQDSVPA